MNLHILFCPAQTVAPDGSMLPTAALALNLDGETQQRCAGFVQTEIERYAEVISDDQPADRDSSDLGSCVDQSEDEGQKKLNGAKRKKGAKNDEIGAHDCLSRRLEWMSEY